MKYRFTWTPSPHKPGDNGLTREFDSESKAFESWVTTLRLWDNPILLSTNIPFFRPRLYIQRYSGIVTVTCLIAILVSAFRVYGTIFPDTETMPVPEVSKTQTVSSGSETKEVAKQPVPPTIEFNRATGDLKVTFDDGYVRT